MRALEKYCKSNSLLLIASRLFSSKEELHSFPKLVISFTPATLIYVIIIEGSFLWCVACVVGHPWHIAYLTASQLLLLSLQMNHFLNISCFYSFCSQNNDFPSKCMQRSVFVSVYLKGIIKVFKLLVFGNITASCSVLKSLNVVNSYF